MNKLSIAIGAAALLFGSAAFATEPVSLNCPKGSVQSAGLVGEKVSCVDKAGKVVPGPMALRHPNGKIAALGQSDGHVKTGLWTVFNDKGQKDFTVTFKASRYHGTKTEFFATGQVKRISQFDNGAPVGEVKEFDITGKLVSTVAAK